MGGRYQQAGQNEKEQWNNKVLTSYIYHMLMVYSTDGNLILYNNAALNQ